MSARIIMSRRVLEAGLMLITGGIGLMAFVPTNRGVGTVLTILGVALMAGWLVQIVRSRRVAGYDPDVDLGGYPLHLVRDLWAQQD